MNKSSSRQLARELWSSFLKRSAFGDRFHQICVDGRPKQKKMRLLKRKRVRVDRQ